MQPSIYYQPDEVEKAVERGEHRAAIGGLWEEMGSLQLEFLKSRGLQPSHHLLDIGCGALRLGVKAVEYLEAGHYFGSDINPALMKAGYRQELDDNLRAKLPENHLHASEDFDFSFLPVPVDMAVAQSLFTHLPLNHLRHCLAKLADHIRMGGLFFATAWIVPEDHPVAEPFQQTGELDGEPITTYPIQDSYHYYAADIHYAARQLPWQLQIIGDWNHPRGQQMLCFMRV